MTHRGASGDSCPDATVPTTDALQAAAVTDASAPRFFDATEEEVVAANAAVEADWFVESKPLWTRVYAHVVWRAGRYVVEIDGKELARFLESERKNAQDFANGYNLALGRSQE